MGLKDKAVATLVEGYQVAKAIAPAGARRGRADADTLGRVAVGYARMGDFERAMQIVQEIQPVSERQGALGDIAIAYAGAGNLEAAVKLAESNPNRNGAMIGIVRHYLQQKQPDQAWQFVQAQQVKGILSEVAVGYLDAGQPEQALQLVRLESWRDSCQRLCRAMLNLGNRSGRCRLLKVKESPGYCPRWCRVLPSKGSLMRLCKRLNQSLIR
jgi:hypothetical protein